MEWHCTDSHPGSEMRYEESEKNGFVWARLKIEGRVVVRPTTDIEKVYRAYQNQYLKFCEVPEAGLDAFK